MTSVITSTAIAATMASVSVPVTSVEPIIENRPVMQQTQHCFQEDHYSSGNTHSTIMGVLGAVAGSMIGKDESSRRIMTGVGAIAGTKYGQRYDTGPRINTTTRCVPSTQQRAVPFITGYKVSYMLDGKQRAVRMNYHPGTHIMINRKKVETCYTRDCRVKDIESIM